MSPTTRRLTTLVRSWVTQPRLARPAGRVFECCGALTLADRVDRGLSDGDITAITLPPTATAVRAHRIKMYRLQGRDQIVRAIHDNGWRGFERPLPDIFCLLVRGLGAGVVYDVGANTGFYGLVAVTANRHVKVQAFEPARQIVPLLERNVALSPYRNRISINPIGVSDQCGTAELYVPPTSGVVETSSSLEPEFKNDHLETYEVPITTIDQHWLQLGCPTVTLIKIDVEGHELPALRGATGIVSDGRPVLVVEVLGSAPMADLEAFIAAHRLVDIRVSPMELVVGDTIQFHELAWNHLFVPREKVDDLLATLKRLEFVITDLRTAVGEVPPPRWPVATRRGRRLWASTGGPAR
jgi:FkbM family methyltransferase